GYLLKFTGYLLKFTGYQAPRKANKQERMVISESIRDFKAMGAEDRDAEVRDMIESPTLGNTNIFNDIE
ncbi:hypothetical protein BgiBS90_032898, partial [Biomphalaria glabrata]